MGFIKNSKFRTVLILALVVGMTLVRGAFAQEADTSSAVQEPDVTTEAADTTVEVTDTAVDTITAPVSSAKAEVSAAAPATPDAGVNIDPQVYKNFFYGVLLIFLICVLVGVIGKILQVYELTRRMNGKDTTYYLSNFNAVLFLVALILGLYGVYWSYVHHGGQSFREAVTEHGKDIDTMFIITTIICTIVLVVMHIGLFSFAYLYRARPTRKAYFYPHNNTIEKIWTI